MQCRSIVIDQAILFVAVTYHESRAESSEHLLELQGGPVILRKTTSDLGTS